MNEFINYNDIYKKLNALFVDALHDTDRSIYEDFLDDYTEVVANDIIRDMKKYVHSNDTNITGCFADIKIDYERETKKDFNSMVKNVDEGKLTDKDLLEIQSFCLCWFFNAFGTYNIVYNFVSFINELEDEF